jgi:hypothetical protein
VAACLYQPEEAVRTISEPLEPPQHVVTHQFFIFFAAKKEQSVWPLGSNTERSSYLSSNYR